MTTFGYEYEVRGHGTAVLARLHKVGAVMNDYLCPYHGCGRECCAHDNPDYLFSAQIDCTVSAEFPSKVLTWDTDRAEQAFATMEWAATDAGADLTGASGMHVHVAKPDLPATTVVDEEADVLLIPEARKVDWRLARIYARYEPYLFDIARGARTSVRNYNGTFRVYNEDAFWHTDLDGPAPMRDGHPSARPDAFAGGGTLELYRHRVTYELRVWNATKAAWRQRLAVGLSVGMVSAAIDGVNVTPEDKRPFVEVIGPYLDDQTVADLLRQHSLTGMEG